MLSSGAVADKWARAAEAWEAAARAEASALAPLLQLHGPLQAEQPDLALAGQPAGVEPIAEGPIGLCSQQRKLCGCRIWHHETTLRNVFQQVLQFGKGKQAEFRRGEIQCGLGLQASPELIDHTIITGIANQFHVIVCKPSERTGNIGRPWTEIADLSIQFQQPRTAESSGSAYLGPTLCMARG